MRPRESENVREWTAEFYVLLHTSHPYAVNARVINPYLQCPEARAKRDVPHAHKTLQIDVLTKLLNPIVWFTIDFSGLCSRCASLPAMHLEQLISPGC
jgi:hypothetical protein